LGMGYEELMAHAARYLLTGEDVEDSSNPYRFLNADTPEEFWDWYQTITGKKLPADRAHHFFKCC
jgi:hypothetical protein